MPLSVDSRRIKSIRLIPWEENEGLFGVAYETKDGYHASDPIGTHAEAELIVRLVEAQIEKHRRIVNAV